MRSAVPGEKPKAGRGARRQALVAVAFGCLAVLSLAPSLHGATTESVRISARTARTEYRIGDRIEYVVAVEWKRPVQLIRIEPSLALGVFEILRSPEVKEKRIGWKWRRRETRYFLSTFETGEFTIPEFTVVYRDEAGVERRVPTPPVKIRVESVAPLRAGEQGIRDAKPPVMPPRRLPPRRLLIALAIAFLLAGAAAVLVAREVRRRRAVAAPAEPPRPIEEIAREKLAHIAQSGLLERGLVKEYFDQISDVVRAYLGQRYGFCGIVTTTSELLEQLRLSPCDDGRLQMIAEFSQQADMAKFARWRPDRQTCEHFLQTAYRVIEETTPKQAPAEATDAHGVGTGLRQDGTALRERADSRAVLEKDRPAAEPQAENDRKGK